MTRDRNVVDLREAKIRYYKEQLESLKEQRTYSERVLFRIYKQLLEDLERQLDDRAG